MVHIQHATANGEHILIANGKTLVESKSEPDRYHVVKLGACDCQGFRRYHHCRHIEAVKAWSRSHQSEADWYTNNVAAIA